MELIVQQGHDTGILHLKFLFVVLPYSRVLGEWVATEKVHGANLCFIIDKTEIKVINQYNIFE